MEEKKYEIKEVLFWGDEIFKPDDLVVIQDNCENLYKGRIVKLKKGTELGKDSYSGKPHLTLDVSDEFKSEVIPVLLDEIETLNHSQGGTDRPDNSNSGCACNPGVTQNPGDDTEKEPDNTPTNPDDESETNPEQGDTNDEQTV